jgi:hypothetical protein
MATAKTWNNTSFTVPDNGDPRGTWGVTLSTFLKALADNALSKYGGSFQLTGADIDFGATYATKQAYLKSRSAGIAADGFLRLANADKIHFRNYLNTADLVLGVSTSDRLQFGAPGAGVNIPTISSTDTLTNKTLTSPVINTPTGIVKGDVGLGNVDNTSDANKPVSTATQTALDAKVTGPASVTANTLPRFDSTTGKLIKATTIAVDDSNNMTNVGTITSVALTASRALIANASKEITVSTVTDTELGYVSGVTSSIQSQLGNKVTGPGSATDNRIARFDGTSGRLIQESTISIDDSGNITGIGSIAGRTSGSAFGAGQIGEKLTGTFLTPTLASGSAVNIMSLTLTAGGWMVYGKAQTGTAGTTYTRFVASISTTSATQNLKSTVADNYGSNDKDREVCPAPIFVNTTGTTVYLVGTCTHTGSNPVATSGYNELYAIRIA